MYICCMCALVPTCFLQKHTHTHTHTTYVFWQVPSQFLLTDAMLKLDEKFNGYLLVCTETETKQDLGGKESRRIKKLLGALRHLFRNSTFSKSLKARRHLQFQLFFLTWIFLLPQRTFNVCIPGLVSHDHNVTSLKSFLQKNPNLRRGKGTDSEAIG